MNTLHDVEQFLRIPGLFTRGLYDKYGPQWAGRKLLQVIWFEEKRKPEVIRNTSFDLRTLPFIEDGSAAARDVAWRRELTPDMAGQWVHHVDKNSQYLSAQRGLYTGYGDPIHQEAGSFDYDPKLPGIYRVQLIGFKPKPFDGMDFPKIIEPGQDWITLDVLKFARKQGYSFNIAEAWVFPSYTRVFDEWADRVWKARAALKAIDAQAYAKMKQIATKSNGAWNWNAADHPSISFIHPNWWADTVGNARVRLLSNLLTYGSPILVETDGLYFVSSNPDPITAVVNAKGESILARSNECGGYKYQGSFEITADIVERARGLNPGQLAKLFKGVSHAV